MRETQKCAAFVPQTTAPCRPHPSFSSHGEKTGLFLKVPSQKRAKLEGGLGQDAKLCGCRDLGAIPKAKPPGIPGAPDSDALLGIC